MRNRGLGSNRTRGKKKRTNISTLALRNAQTAAHVKRRRVMNGSREDSVWVGAATSSLESEIRPGTGLHLHRLLAEFLLPGFDRVFPGRQEKFGKQTMK